MLKRKKTLRNGIEKIAVSIFVFTGLAESFLQIIGIYEI